MTLTLIPDSAAGGTTQRTCWLAGLRASTPHGLADATSADFQSVAFRSFARSGGPAHPGNWPSSNQFRSSVTHVRPVGQLVRQVANTLGSPIFPVAEYRALLRQT